MTRWAPSALISFAQVLENTNEESRIADLNSVEETEESPEEMHVVITSPEDEVNDSTLSSESLSIGEVMTSSVLVSFTNL